MKADNYKTDQTHFYVDKGNDGSVDAYVLAPGITLSFNQIYTNSWMKGDSSVFSDRMLIFNFCIAGRCDVSLTGNRYAMLALVNEEWSRKDDQEPGYLRYMAARLLHELLDMPSEGETDTYFTRSQISIVREAENIIMQDLSRRITAKEMADRFGISESSFKLYVKGILGDTYLSYFRRKRMEKAAELLESTNMKVIDIANAVGYENQGKFARAFAECYGSAPLEFRCLSK